MDENQTSKKKTDLVGTNIATIIITTCLLLTLIIFFTTYSLANNKKLNQIKSNYEPSTETENISGEIKKYSYFNNDDGAYSRNDNDKIISNKEEDKTSNITGEVEISRDSFLKKSSDDPIGGFSDPLYDSLDDEKDNSKTKEDEKPRKTSETESSKTFTTDKTDGASSKTRINTTTKTTITATRKEKINYPRIYNIKAYDKTVSDPYINDVDPYIIQIATHNYMKSAQHIRDILILEDFNSYILNTEFEGKTKYRIRIGPFSTKTRAVNAWKKLVKGSKIKDVEKSIILVKK